VATATDLVAVGLLHAAHSLRVSVPDQLSVVGYDDILIATHTVPALTTLRMPIAEIVRHAVTKVIDLARDPSASREPRLELFAPALIVRGSTAPPAAPAKRGRR
jgi:DNA-binding LacI/PurR family transcriptional regulator